MVICNDDVTQMINGMYNKDSFIRNIFQIFALKMSDP